MRACRQCAALFSPVAPSHVFCSRQCKNAHRRLAIRQAQQPGGYHRECPFCHESFTTVFAHQRCCSKSCASKAAWERKRPQAADSQRLLAQVVIPDDSAACWLWQGRKDGKGYGLVYLYRRRHPVRAHRAAYELFVGPIPAGLDVLHTCDTPACVHLSHLYLGTNTDNVRDRVVRGRQQRGEAVWCARLGPVQVREIRALRQQEWLAKDIAPLFGISVPYVSAICTRRKWKHVA